MISVSEMLQTAINILDVKENDLHEFEVEDTFNGKTLHGVISKRNDHRYGALIIFAVDGIPCAPQVIYGTPKMHYPFDKTGVYKWPKINELQAWEKLDGSNVLSFWYRDSLKHKWYVTYKTRLSPIIKDSSFGGFKTMWLELLEDNPWIRDVIKKNPAYNLSFELYGSRNPITIKYKEPLTTALLFGIERGTHNIHPPKALILPKEVRLPAKVVYNKEDPTEFYNNMRASCSKANAEELTTEGLVLYVNNGESWTQIKMKPEEIEKIHWSSGGIPANSIWTTCINAFEDREEVDLPYVTELLKEDFNDQQIIKSENRIKKIFSEARAHVVLTKQVNDVWARARSYGLDITEDKDATMRFMSNFFKKEDMRKVGTIVLKQAGLI